MTDEMCNSRSHESADAGSRRNFLKSIAGTATIASMSGAVVGLTPGEAEASAATGPNGALKGKKRRARVRPSVEKLQDEHIREAARSKRSECDQSIHQGATPRRQRRSRAAGLPADGRSRRKRRF
jgi:hypothetical protein